MDTSELGLSAGTAARRSARHPARVDGAACFVLHSYPYKETSLILEAWTREHGRIALVARGARRPRSALRGLLQAFQPLSVSFAGLRQAGNDMATLHSAEWLAGIPALTGEGLICGFYINELILKLLARHDPHERLFDSYSAALVELARTTSPAPVLRAFEYQLLSQIGYALSLDEAADGSGAIDARHSYRYVAERGLVTAQRADEGELLILGKTLADIALGDYSDPVTLMQSKLLMRQLIHQQLAGQVLRTRQMMVELHDL